VGGNRITDSSAAGPGGESAEFDRAVALCPEAGRDRRLQALDDFLAAYEAEHGEITEETRDAARRARSRAVVVRGTPEAGRLGMERRG
jgi:hypothetical protein